MARTGFFVSMLLSVAFVLPMSGCECCQDTGDEGLRPPVDAKTALGRSQWAEAVRGLDFSTGMVVVTEADRRPDSRAAAAHMETGREMIRTNRKTPAVKAFADALRSDPSSVEAYLGLGEAMILKGREVYAAACYRTVIALEPERVEAHVALGHALAMAGEHAAAIESMNTALELDSSLGEAHERLAVWHYYSQSYDAARWHADEAARLGSPCPPQFIELLNTRK
jgi:Tfp pilus assembly protein PilF